MPIYKTIKLALIITLTSWLLACFNDAPAPVAIDPGFSAFTIYGRVLAPNKVPMRGVPIEVFTEFRKQKVTTDSQGEYQVTSHQGYGEATIFIFTNEVGDAAHYQTILDGARAKQIDFIFDEKGSVKPYLEQN